jgi:hypothetical protein
MRTLGVVIVGVVLFVVVQFARVGWAILHEPKRPSPSASLAPTAAPADPEPSCDDSKLKAEYAASGSSMKYEDWCGATIAGARLMWRNKHLPTASAETICAWKSPYHVALKCEGTLPESDPFMIASTSISEVGAESISWVIEHWREESQIPRDINAFRSLGLEPYAVLLEKAKAARDDKKKLEAIGDEWDALERQHVFADWFEKNCATLVTCTPR